MWLLSPLVALAAAAISYVILLLPLALSWMTAPETDVTWRGSARVAGLGWLVAHDAAIRIESITYTLLPWGLVLIPCAILIMSTRWLGRFARIVQWQRALIAVLLVSLTYAVVAAVIARATSETDAAVGTWAAFISAGVIAAGGSVWGLAASGSWKTVLARVPSPVTVMVRAGALGFFLLLAIAALLTTVAAILGFDRMLSIAVGLDAGAAGGLVLLVTQIAYVPMLIVWVLSYLAGAGVNLGSETLLSPFVSGVTPTQLPSAPLLALLPENAGTFAWALPILVVVAGTVVGILVGRRARDENWMMRIVIVIGATSTSALAVFAITAISSGSWGIANLARMGPDPGLTAMIVWILLTMGAIPVSLVVVARRSRHLEVLREAGGENSVSVSSTPPVRLSESHDELV